MQRRPRYPDLKSLAWVKLQKAQHPTFPGMKLDSVFQTFPAWQMPMSFKLHLLNSEGRSDPK